MPFPWGRENKDLMAHYRALGAMRHKHPALKNGAFSFLCHTESAFAFERVDGETKDRLIVVANMGDEPFVLPLRGIWRNALTSEPACRSVTLKKQEFIILEQI